MSDFSQYGDPSEEWMALGAKLPPQPAGLSILERRTATNHLREKLSAEVMEGLGPSVSMQNHMIQTRDGSNIEARTYRPVVRPGDEALPVYVHLHGGGFLFGTLNSEDAICSRISINAGVVVFNVNYRHTPEHTYPTAWDDVEDAFEWLHDHVSAIGGDQKRVVIGGISAGAWLGASLVLRKHQGQIAASRPPIAGLVLMIPSLVNMDCYGPQMGKLKDPSVSSVETCKDAPILPRAVCRMFTDMLKVPKTDLQVDDLRLNPGNASPEKVQGFPPTVFGVAGMDPLRDEGLLFAMTLAEASVPTDVNIFPGLPHGFRRYGDSLSECERWDKVMENGIMWVLSGPVASPFLIKSE